MSERKVLNKYYPKDYDPGNIPRAKRPKNRQWTIRTMAPFNMRCNTCGEYIYKGKKFNSRQELAEGETYLGLKIFRFYIKCPKCVSEITFKTDPQSVDYVLEAGATRNFEALRTAELMAQKEAAEKEAELENNPMKMLENRTKASQREMDMLETLEDLRELNSKHAKVDMNELIEEKVRQQQLFEEKLKQLQEEEDEAFVQSVFGKNSEHVVKRLPSDDESDGDSTPTPSKQQRLQNPTDFLIQEGSSKSGTNEEKSCGIVTSTAAGTSSTPASSGANSSGSQPSSSQQKKNVLKNTLVKPKKTNLSMLVKKKDTSTVSNESGSTSKPGLYEMVKQREAEMSKSISAQKSSANVSTVSSSKSDSDSKHEDESGALKDSTATAVVGPQSGAKGGLSLVGSYTDSDESSENE